MHYIIAFLLGATLMVSGCSFLGSHGPAKDKSKFGSAVLVGSNTVLFTYQHTVYRPAQGMAAFPDGGQAKYDKDVNILGTCDLTTGKVRVLRRDKNRLWTPDQGHFFASMANGPMALVTQSGQLRRNLSETLMLTWLIDTVSGSMQEINLDKELTAQGLDPTAQYMVDPRGTLLFVTIPAGMKEDKATEADTWLWIRTPAGKYVKVANTSHYITTEGDEVIYWMLNTRRFHAFHVVRHTTRDLPGYREKGAPDITRGVRVEDMGQRLELGNKVNGEWRNETIPLSPDQFK